MMQFEAPSAGDPTLCTNPSPPKCHHISTPQLAGKAHQLGCPKIVLDHVHVYKKNYVCAHHNA